MFTSHDPDTVQFDLFISIRQLVTCLAGSVVKKNIGDDGDDDDGDDDDDDTKENKDFIFITIIIVVSLDDAYSSETSNESMQYQHPHYNYINTATGNAYMEEYECIAYILCFRFSIYLIAN